jgi:hypothetical protein
MRLALSVVLVGTLVAAPLRAQEQPRPADSVPASARPPAGMCRIWLPNVPANKQAAPTDCPTAVRNRPANARVIFGDPLPPPKGSAKPGQLPVPLPLAPTDPGKKKKTPPPKTPPPDRSER